MKGGISNRLVAGLLFSVFASQAIAQEDPAIDGAFEARHKQAVELARADQTDKGLAMLEALLVEQPNNYDVRRDYVIILTWVERCDEALVQFELIRHRPVLEPYLYPPVSECMANLRDTDRAVVQLEEGMQAHPEDKEIKDAFAALQSRIAFDSAPTYEVTAGSTKSSGETSTTAGPKADSFEWYMSARYSDEITSRTRWYVRHYVTMVDDKEAGGIETGDISRTSIGLRHWYNPQWILDAAVSREMKTELDDQKQNGAQVGLTHFVNDNLEINVGYANNAEDVPMRAKFQGTTVNRTTLSADYHTAGYVWELSGSLSRYNFIERNEAEDNQRTSFYGSVGYGYDLKDDTEHRLIVEASTSRNSQTGGSRTYYNPEKDKGLTLVHRSSFVFDSEYERHVDHLSIFAGQYNQEGFDAESVHGVRYEQAYDFSRTFSLGIGAGWASNVYDGDRESQISFSLSLSGRLP